MRFKFFVFVFLTLFLITSIYVGNIINFVLFYKDALIINFLGANYKNDRSPILKLEGLVEAQKYIDEQPDIEMVPSTLKEAINKNVIVGNSLGFLSENVKSQKDLITKFPYGLLTLPNLSLDLSTRKVSPPYGTYNHNYLSPAGEIIYSDDLDILKVIADVLKSLNQNQLYKNSDFHKSYTLALKNHWIEMKNSGDYGEDGLYYGKRGYSNMVLLFLANLNPSSVNLKNNMILPNVRSNFSLGKASLIGMERRISEERAFQLGELQSYVIQDDKEIAISCGALALLIKHFSENLHSSKNDIINYWINILVNRVKKEESIILDAIYLGKSLHNLAVSPIIVYNKIPGSAYDQLLTLAVYSFLEFEDFAEAMKYIIHTPGDNDSLLVMLAFLYGVHDEKAVPDFMLNFFEGKNIKLIE